MVTPAALQTALRTLRRTSVSELRFVPYRERRDLMFVADVGVLDIFVFDKDETAADDGVEVVKPNDLSGAEPGRLVKLKIGKEDIAVSFVTQVPDLAGPCRGGEGERYNDAACDRHRRHISDASIDQFLRNQIGSRSWLRD